MGVEGESIDRPIFRDIRRYYCEYCGICRSKKSLINSHVNAHHKEEIEKAKAEGDGVEETEGVKPNTCKECGAIFKKPAYLRQHMQSHSLERPFLCTVDGCQSSFRRKDHLKRHILQHQGKLFKCPIEGCNREFSVQANMKRHVKEIHSENSSSTNVGQKQHACPEVGCGKVFKYASQLRKHENSHVKLESIEAVCLDPGCMKHFTNVKCLKAHNESCHQYINCEICGKEQFKRNIRRHLRTHEMGGSLHRIKCLYRGCLLTFSSKSNLRKHMKAVHFKVKPYVCGFPGCNKRFAYKHVRDNHEKAGLHVYTTGDFLEVDERFRSRPRGGRKRKCPTVEMLIRKRVTPPSILDPLFADEAEQE